MPLLKYSRSLTFVKCVLLCVQSFQNVCEVCAKFSVLSMRKQIFSCELQNKQIFFHHFASSVAQTVTLYLVVFNNVFFLSIF